MRMLTVAAGVALVLQAANTGAQPAAVAPTPTYTEHVAPILQQRCGGCHRPDGIGPMALHTYQDARRHAFIIKSRVEQRVMPPWHLDRTVGIQEYKNDISLTDDQIATITRWGWWRRRYFYTIVIIIFIVLHAVGSFHLYFFIISRRIV